MEIGMLGPVRVVDADGRELRVTARQRELLALLAWQSGHAVSRARLIDALWGEQLPANPGNALQQRVFHTRRLLLEGGCEALATDGSGYRLDLPREHIDAHRFERARVHGRRALDEGRLTEAQRSLASALDEWRGEALQDVAGPWAASVARRLEEDRLATLEDRLEADVALGDSAEVIGELEDLIAAHPLRERFHGLLMQALAATGRQADALAVYTRTRTRLADELGIDPSPALQRVHADVLAQREAAAPPARATAPGAEPEAAHVADAGRGVGLPIPVSRFVGRRREVDRLRSLLAADRIVTVTGPGGAGKTRLALETARELHATDPDAGDITLVELGGVTDPDAVPSVVAGALGVDGEHGTPLIASLINAVGHRRLRLLVDNCEHLVDAVAELVGDLVPRCPELRVLATSREPLGVDGEVVWPLDTLPVPDEHALDLEVVRRFAAVELLLDRVGAVAPDHVPQPEEVPAIVRIVRELDGLPLAIELAAARARAMSLDEIAERLRDRFTLLSGGRRGSPARHQALTATLEWSWELLEPTHRTAWMAASVPAGPFSAELYTSLIEPCEPAVDAVDAVVALCDRSLLRVERDGVSSRYAMLSTVREFGLQRLAESGIESTIRDAHADAVERALAASDRTTWASWDVDLEAQRGWLPEVRAAMRWRERLGDRRGMQRLAAGLGWLAFLTALTSEGRRLLDLALGPLETLHPADVEPRAVLWSAGLRIGDADGDGAAWADLAIQISDDDPVARVLAHGFKATYLAMAGQVPAALRLMEQETRVGGWLDGMGNLLEGKLLMFLGDLDAAERAVHEGQRMLDEGGAWSSLLAGDILVLLAQLRGDAAGVRTAARRGIAACRQRRTAELEIELRCFLAMVEAAVGDADAADAELAAARGLADDRGPAMSAALLAHTEAYTAWRRGAHAVAERWWRDALDLHHWTGLAFGRPFALWGLAHLALARGDVDDADGLAHASLQEATVRGDHDATATALEGCAAVALRRHDALGAARLLGAARATRVAMGAPHPLITRDLAAATERSVRDQLGEDRFATAHRDGLHTPQELLTSVTNG